MKGPIAYMRHKKADALIKEANVDLALASQATTRGDSAAHKRHMARAHKLIAEAKRVGRIKEL